MFKSYKLKTVLLEAAVKMFYYFLPSTFSLSSFMVGQFLALVQGWKKKDKITCKLLILHGFLYSKVFPPISFFW